MKYLICLILVAWTFAPALLSAQQDANNSLCLEMLSKAEKALAEKKYPLARDYCEAALPLCTEYAARFREVQNNINKGIDLQKKDAIDAGKKSEIDLKNLRTASEKFVRRFLSSAAEYRAEQRFASALDKINTAAELKVLPGEVAIAFQQNIDACWLYKEDSMALESVRLAVKWKVFTPEKLGNVFLAVVDSSIRHANHAVALDGMKSLSALRLQPKEVLSRCYLDLANSQILYLDYEAALASLDSAISLGLKSKELQQNYLEIAFWYAESGNAKKAAALLTVIAGMTNNTNLSARLRELPSDTLAAREHLRSAMKAADSAHFRYLFEEKYYPDMVPVSGGFFNMGCDSLIDMNCAEDEVLHRQELSSFQIASTETTVWQFELFREASKTEETTYSGSRGDHPATDVSWYDAVEYANWVSLQKALKPYYQIDRSVRDTVFNKNKYDDVKWLVLPDSTVRSAFRLPTEAEWEYAAKGGNATLVTTIYSGGNNLDEVGWYDSNSGGETNTVGKKYANALGLYDMSGNVWEWCQDWYGDYKKEAEKDYHGPGVGSFRVSRGGSWDRDPENCRVAIRNGFIPDFRYNLVGFRLVLVP